MILGSVSNWPPFLWLFKKPSIRLATVVNLTETHKAAYFQLINFAVKQVLVSRDPGLEKLLSDSIEWYFGVNILDCINQSATVRSEINSFSKIPIYRIKTELNQNYSHIIGVQGLGSCALLFLIVVVYHIYPRKMWKSRPQLMMITDTRTHTTSLNTHLNLKTVRMVWSWSCILWPHCTGVHYYLKWAQMIQSSLDQHIL